MQRNAVAAAGQVNDDDERACVIQLLVGLWSGVGRVRTYRRKGSIEPGSMAIFGSVSHSENHFMAY